VPIIVPGCRSAKFISACIHFGLQKGRNSFWATKRPKFISVYKKAEMNFGLQKGRNEFQFTKKAEMNFGLQKSAEHLSMLRAFYVVV